jgi:hypothetical protein
VNISKVDLIKNSRLALGITLLLIALLAAGLISKEANRTVKVWAAQSNLAPGMSLTEQDLTSVSVLLPNSSKNYISSKAQIVGAIVLNSIYEGDLIPVAAIANSTMNLNQKLFPISCESNDCPENISRGDIVDIYVIPNQDSKFIDQPQLVEQNISVSNVFNDTSTGKKCVLVQLNAEQVLPVLQLISDSRAVIVKSL